MVFISNLPNNVKDEAYVVNLDGYKSIGKLCIAVHINGNRVTGFDTFDV